jgi:hypothetical protein
MPARIDSLFYNDGLVLRPVLQPTLKLTTTKDDEYRERQPHGKKTAGNSHRVPVQTPNLKRNDTESPILILQSPIRKALQQVHRSVV